MNPRVKEVIANGDFTLLLRFSNDEVRLFDARPYLEKGIFRELQDIRLFKTAKVFDGTVQWIHGQDLCPDTLYLKSTRVKNFVF
jgi:hypothetical protein